MGAVMGSVGPAPNTGQEGSVTSGGVLRVYSLQSNLPVVVVQIAFQGKPGIKGGFRPICRECFVHDPLAVLINSLSDEWRAMDVQPDAVGNFKSRLFSAVLHGSDNLPGNSFPKQDIV